MTTAERAERVGGGVAQHALEVDVLALAAGQHDGRGDVAGEAEQAEAEHPDAVDLGRIAETARSPRKRSRSQRRRAAAR